MPTHRLRRFAPLALALAAGCGPTPDILGPFTGVTRRFVIDRLDLPLTFGEFSADLDGDGERENAYAMIMYTAEGYKNGPVAAVPGMLAAGALAPEIEITLDNPDLRIEDPVVGVRWLGAPGEAGDTVGGVLSRGVFASNRTRTTRHPATVTVHLPLFIDADPVAVSVTGVEIDLVRDGEGVRGELHGGVVAHLAESAYAAFLSMMSARPEEHRIFHHLLDRTPADGTITLDEFRNGLFIEYLTTFDVSFFDAQGRWGPSPSPSPLSDQDALSVGFGFHAVPCDAGSCRPQMVTPRCDDRVRNGDETDVDCGGSCHPCRGGASCKLAADCQSGSCASNTCAPLLCNDGQRQSYESDVDCGGFCPRFCEGGKTCVSASDCAFDSCVNGRCK